MASRIESDLIVTGSLQVSGTMNIPNGAVTNAKVATGADIERAKLEQEPLASYPQKLTDCRVWDAYQTNLPGTSATDVLGLYGGTFGTGSPLVRTYDVKAAGAQTLRARLQIVLPPEYEAGETVQIRLKCGMVTTVADVSCTVDVEAYEVDRAGGISADLCTTSATTMNSLSFADKDFTLTATSLAPGDILDVRISVAVNDAATATAVIAAIGSIELLCDIRG